jgi:DNA-binding transcriptional LysR family regulator
VTGQRHPRISQDLLFDDPNVTLDAAVRGHGVMLTHIFHAEDYLRQGLLVAPMDRSALTAETLYLSWRKSGGEALDRVADWLLQSLRASAQAVYFRR